MMQVDDRLDNVSEVAIAPDRIRLAMIAPSAVDTKLTARLVDFFLRNPVARATLMHLSRVLDFDYTVQMIVHELDKLVRAGFLLCEDDGLHKRYWLNPEARKRLD